MSATDPFETIEFNLAMRERIVALGAVPVVTDLSLPQACNMLHRQLINLLAGVSSVSQPGWVENTSARSGGPALAIPANNDGYLQVVAVNFAAVTLALPDPATVRAGWNATIRYDSRTVAPATLQLTTPAGTIAGESALFEIGDMVFVARVSAARYIAMRVQPEPRHNLAAAADPTPADDNTLGYGRWSRWANAAANTLWACADPATGAAVWIQLGLAIACLGGAYVGGAYGSGPSSALSFVNTVTVDGGAYA